MSVMHASSCCLPQSGMQRASAQARHHMHHHALSQVALHAGMGGYDGTMEQH